MSNEIPTLTRKDEKVPKDPLEEGDFDEVFFTTVNQAFPSEEDFKSDDDKASPGDTAEDPIPKV